MNPYYQDKSLTIYAGDTRRVLPQLESESVNCCVTSPPYYGLRDYGMCLCRKGRVQHESSTMTGSQAGTPTEFGPADNECPHCNGTGKISGMEKQIGLEKTPEEYVAELVAVFREVRRVLRDDGTLWLNLGDSYSAVYSGNSGYRDGRSNRDKRRGPGIAAGLKPKDLIGIPWRVAFALQADGWYLRQDIIWHKPNPMPESVTDRCTKAHEYIFLLSKSARYYYDQDAIKEPADETSLQRWAQNIDGQHGSGRVPGKTNGTMKAVGGPQSHKGSRFDTGKTARHQLNRAQKGERVHGNRPGRDDGGAACNKLGQETRNKRSVWTVATQPYREAHFAVFPPALIRPCILAGCPIGGTVLDPFGGSGTTAEVAEEEGRNVVLIELNPEYLKLQKKRTAQRGLFCEVSQ